MAGGIGAAALLEVWEKGHSQPPLRRALVLVELGSEAAEDLAAIPLGERDRRLLDIRSRVFGSTVVCLATCPRCAGDLEATFDVADVVVAGSPPPAGTIELESDGHQLEIRLPTSADLEAIQDSGDRERARGELLSRCVVLAMRGGRKVRPERLPEPVQLAVSAALAQADPQADVKIGLVCPSCDASWDAPFDVASFLWDELGAWAERTLREVHTLASAYGWAESEILSMHPFRRHRYLEMLPA